MSNVGARSGDVHPLLQLMRDYAFAYTANHDFDVCPTIMIEEYELRMGAHRIVGRDGAYRDATQRQYDQYPGLGFTVHDIVTNGERVALRFSEHGHSIFQEADSVWGGVSLYRWDGSRLTSCLVEQDYFARRRQLTDARRELRRVASHRSLDRQHRSSPQQQTKMSCGRGFATAGSMRATSGHLTTSGMRQESATSLTSTSQSLTTSSVRVVASPFTSRSRAHSCRGRECLHPRARPTHVMRPASQTSLRDR